ncbi:MAG: glycosyltransferase, partial [Bacteroidota bacterium]|nr:glycosyltransferase [Bacteroidota bacterium]
METFLWIAVFILFYTYIGYGLLLLLITAKERRKKEGDKEFFPSVTFIVPAYNEEAIIENKIRNTLLLQYPADKLSFLFVTDGSIDTTVEIVRRYPQIRFLHQPVRQGKSAAIN